MRVWLVFGLLVSCKDKGDSGGKALPAICNAGSAWDGEQEALRDASEDWGLPDLGATGVVINAVDYDGDGWVDLAVRGHGGADDFSEGGARSSWLLRNLEGEGFEDVTRASGIVALRSDGGAGDIGRPGEIWAFGDVDNDGDLDVFTGCPSHLMTCTEPSEIMLNNGDGTFTHGPEDSELRLTDSFPSAASFVDIDRDGNLDLWVPQYNIEQDHLYLGAGDGSFTDETRAAGLTTSAWSSVSSLNQAKSHTNAWSGVACDLNNDGDPELLAASYGRAPNHLWRAKGDGTFENESVASGYAFDDRTDWSDNESARCWCTLHPDDADCSGIPAPELIGCAEDADAFRWDHTYDREAFRLGGSSGETTCIDVNNDGWLDLMTAEIVHWDVGSSSDPSELLLNEQDDSVRFQRPGGEATGLTREHTLISWNDGDITNSVFDFDNDGWADIYIGASEYAGNYGLLYRQAAPETFVSVPVELGVDHYRSHGSVTADFDRDGDLDLVVGHSSSRCDDECYETFTIRLFENEMGAESNFIQLDLVGGDANRAAIGARVAVTADGTTQTRLVDGGHGHYGSQDDRVLHFGLGEACEAEVTITWPDGSLTEQTLSLGGGYRYRIPQGEPAIVINP
ncbi:MAG: hypothetical protein ACI8S6_001241 [Myxococcota bacterium]|jgi:hypothetical protein